MSRPGASVEWGMNPSDFGDEIFAKKVKKTFVPPPGPPPLPIGLLFPGQGSQYVKMMNGVQDIPKVKEMLDKATDLMGLDLLELCMRGPETKLEETRYCQ